MRRILLIITFIAISSAAFSDTDVMAEQLHVFDSAHVLTDNELQALTNKIDSISQLTATRMRIYTTTDLRGFGIADFARRIGEGWTGPDGFDNGIVIVYRHNNENGRYDAAIAVGRNLEHLIHDTIGRRIVERQMIPLFDDGLVYKGIDKALDECFQLTQSNSTIAESETQERRGLSKEDATALFLFIAFWVAMLILAKSTIRGDHYTTESRNGGGTSWAGGYSGRFGGSGANGRW